MNGLLKRSRESATKFQAIHPPLLWITIRTAVFLSIAAELRLGRMTARASGSGLHEYQGFISVRAS